MSAAALRAALQPLVDAQAVRVNAGVTLAFRNADVSIEIASGHRSRASPANATPTDVLMWGSITKMYTASAVLKLAEQGALDLDDPVRLHVDGILQQLNGTTLADLFGAESASRVTVRHLLSMRSGLYDFDDDETRRFCNAHPNITVSPLDDLAFASTRGARTPLYPAGTKQDYSSTNFELLGLIVAAKANATRWDAPNLQRDAVFGTAELRRRFSRTAFALHGPCSDYAQVHGYEPDDAYGLDVDTAFMSCTNGWTCGNIAAPAAEVADFVWALYGTASIVSRASVDAMTKIWDGDGGWYGLGTMGLPGYVGGGGKRYCRVGHCGVTYGYTAVASYNRVLNYSLVWGMGQEDPGQTRTHGAYYDYLLSFDCEVTAALLGVLEGAPKDVNCSAAHVNTESWACSE